MNGLPVRTLLVLATVALLLAFAFSFALVTSQNAASVADRPLVNYGTR
jgi:hypothetical protein